MHTTLKWSETLASDSDVPPPVYGVSCSPSGDTIIASCGTTVVIYDATTGAALHSIKGHTDTVNCVSYSYDGKNFASGGADKCVILWTTNGEGVLKYRHKESVQALSFNPVTGELASVSSADYGIWSPTQPKVGKNSLPSRGLCLSWTRDGRTLAIGLFDGIILIHTEKAEKFQIKRSAPVWALVFAPMEENGTDVLVAGSWDRRLSFYTSRGKPIGKEKELQCDPCCISVYGNGPFLLIGGSDHKLSLYTMNGNMLATVMECNDWVWAAQQRPRQQQVCCGTNDGSISVVEISTHTVHSIYNDQYVCCDKMTDVVVHQLTLDKKLRIPCNNYVCKLAMYRDRVAVQLHDEFVIFEIFYDDGRQMSFQDVAHIWKKMDCTLLSVTFNAILLCHDRRLTMYDFQGNKRREWTVESSVTFMKVVGGAEGREGLLLGLKNGAVLRVFVDNPFFTTLVKINMSIRSLDISSTRSKIAVVDENNLLQVFDLENNKAVLFTETGVIAVSWNSEYDDMISYTSVGNMLNIKTGSLPPYQQNIPGFVVGFKANRVFNLNGTTIEMVDVPHSHALYRYVEKKDFDSAFRIASLGVTEGDWKMLGMHAMTQLRLDIAQRAFIRIHEVKFVELLKRLELEKNQNALKGGTTDSGLLVGDILAYQGKYQEAARQFLKAGHENRAIEMFCDMKMWSEAKKICQNELHLKDLIRQQARWAEDSQNFVEAASLYQACDDRSRAIAMLCSAGQIDKLMDICRSFPKSEVALITECAEYFKKNGAIQYALDAYEKVGDFRSLIALHVEENEWQQAFTLLERYPQYVRHVYVPWANWLADGGYFNEALEAYRVAKWPKEAIRMLESLAANSVICRRYRDASFYFIRLAQEYGILEDGQQLTEAEWATRIKLSAECVLKANIYYAYHFVYLKVTQPFLFDGVALLNLSRYLLALIGSAVIPMNVGKGELLYTLARIAAQLGMNRTACLLFERLQSVVLPLKVAEQVDVDSLLIRSKGYTDREELLDFCYRCRQTVPQLSGPGDCCPNCYHPFVRSFVKFESLPLVEFVLANNLTDAEAERIILTEMGRNDNKKGDDGNCNEWKSGQGADVVTFIEEEENIDAMINHEMQAMGRGPAAGSDPFQVQLAHVTRPGRQNAVYQPFVVNAGILRRMRREEVFIVKPGFGTLPTQNKYYRLVNDNIGIMVCPGCQHFFKDLDYEYECMKGKGCPLCGHKIGRNQERTMKKILFDVLGKQSQSLK